MTVDDDAEFYQNMARHDAAAFATVQVSEPVDGLTHWRFIATRTLEDGTKRRHEFRCPIVCGRPDYEHDRELREIVLVTMLPDYLEWRRQQWRRWGRIAD